MRNDKVKVTKIKGGYRLVWVANEQPIDCFMFIAEYQAKAEADRLNAIWNRA